MTKFFMSQINIFEILKGYIMRIKEVSKNTLNLSFKSLRQDKTQAKQLVTGKNSIISNNKENILTAINNLSGESKRDNIEFLLYLADNLAYGQGKNSVFKDVLDKDGITPQNRENTDWIQILDDSVRRLIADSDEDVSDLIDDYSTIFYQKKELTPLQKEVLDLRAKLTSQVIGNSKNKDSVDIEQITNIRQNLDYFTASSEVSLSEKKDCLEKLCFIMSDKYKINPQLKNRKQQVLNEILNDIVVKTPNDDVLKTKKINQRQSGICAAISICRTLMAYENKSGYIDLITEELKDSPKMSVYDVTELGTGKKTVISKPEVNYNYALSKGYRIVDASAHIWMNNAHTSGDGSIQSETYIPFDSENYGLYNDSSWLTLGDDKQDFRKLLRDVIKERETLDSLYKTKKERAEIIKSVDNIKCEAFENKSKSIGKLDGMFSSLFPEKTQRDITELVKSVISFYRGVKTDNEVNVPSKLDNDTKTAIIKEFITSSVPDMTDEKKELLQKYAVGIYEMADEYVQADKKLEKLKKFNTPKGHYVYYKKLFNAAAAHRIAVERDLSLADGPVRFEKLTGLPPRDTQISNYMNSLRTKLNSYSLRNEYKNENGEVPSQQEMEKELVSDMVKLDTIIPRKENNILTVLLGSGIDELVVKMYRNLIEAINNGDNDALANIKMSMNEDADKKNIIQKLEKIVDKISKQKNEDDIKEAVRILGYEDRMQFTTAVLSAFVNSMRNGISENEYNRLVRQFGGKEMISDGIQSQLEDFNEISSEYRTILNKWKVPPTRNLILNKLESNGDVLSRKDLDTLYNHFNSIQTGVIANENIPNTKLRAKKNEKLYTFSPEHIELFKKIEKNLPSMRKYSNMEYKNLNDLLYDELEEIYSANGMLNGQFWVREEGSTGLAANEQVRIIEQMTGKPYHIETNIRDAVKQIKEGKGSGILSMSVLDDDYAFHAQYVPSVTSELFTDKKTGEVSTNDIIWTDNSWGNAEKDSFWNGRNGFDYTDYGSGYGWKDGFVLAKDRKIGLPVKDMHGAMGYSKEDKEEFGLFTDVVLPGSPVNVYQRLYKVFDYILNMDEGVKNLESLEKSLKNGQKLNIDAIDRIDDISSERVDNITKRIDKEIKSEADFDKLSDNDPLKFAFKKLAVFLSTDNPMLADSVITVNDNDELDEITDAIFEEHVNVFNTILGKTDEALKMIFDLTSSDFDNIFKKLNDEYGVSFDENQIKSILSGIFFDTDALEKHTGRLSDLEKLLNNQVLKAASLYFDDEKPLRFFIEESQKVISKTIDKNLRIKSLDSHVLTKSPLYEELIASVDKYLNPESDEILLKLIQQMQEADYDTMEKFTDSLKPEDVGLKIKKPYDCLLLYKAGNGQILKAFNDVIVTGEIYKNLESIGYADEDSPIGYYRSMLVKLADMDIQKYIKDFKEEAFRKYKVRQAFPDPVVISDDKINATADKAIEKFKSEVDSIRTNKFVLNVLESYDKLCHDFIYNPDFAPLFSQDLPVNEENNKKYITPFYNAVNNFYNLTKTDDSLASLNQVFVNIISILKNANKFVSSNVLNIQTDNISHIFSSFKDAGVTKEKFRNMVKSEVNTLKSNIQLSVNSNIDPKYRDETIAQLNKILNMYKKNKDDENLELEENIYKGMFVSRHIVKNPTQILKEVVKLLLNGKSESDEYKILREYLEEALKVAQQTKIQYLLVQNQHEAISSKTKDMLPLFKVFALDGTTEKMDSEMGMQYLVEKLRNEDDNYKTLNLFLRQTGLSKRAMSALINNFEIEKTDALVREKTKEILKDLSSLDKLSLMIKDYLNSDMTSYPTIEAGMQSLNKYVKRKLPHYKDNIIFKNFVNYVDSLQYTKNADNTSDEIKKSLIDQITVDALQYLADFITQEIKYYSEINELIREQKNLLNSIEVPVGSEEYKMRVKFDKRYQKTEAAIAGEMQKVIEAFEKSSVMDIVTE